MAEMTVRRISCDGTGAVYRAMFKQGRDRMRWDLALSHGDTVDFGAGSSAEELVTYVVEWLVIHRDPERIPSSATFQELLILEPDLRHELEQRVNDPDAGIREYLTGASPAS